MSAHTPGPWPKLPHVEFVDDERDIGNGVIVTLAEGYEFTADPGCGVRGFDTIAKAKRGCARANIARTALAKVTP